MALDFPRAYRVIRQGQGQTVSVVNLAELFTLRAELEIIRRFGAGATPELVAVIDARLAQAGTADTDEISRLSGSVRDLQEIRGILCDSLAPANAQAIAEIDCDFPEICARLPMSSIAKDTQEFHKDVVDQIQAGDTDVDAMLAAFEEAAVQGGDARIPTNPEASDDEIDAILNQTAQAAGVDAAIEAPSTSDPSAELIEAVALELGEAGLDEAELGEAAESFAEQIQPVSEIEVEAVSELEAVAELEAVSERVAESLSGTEQQLDAIAAAFETAAAELGQITDEVQQDGESASAVSLQIDATQASACESVSASAISHPAADKPGVGSATAGVKAQIQQARSKILSELDDLMAMLERVDQMQAQADASLQRAQKFELSAAQAQEAGQRLAEAEAEAAKTRAMFEEAQLRVSAARESWEQARQQAASAAAACAG